MYFRSLQELGMPEKSATGSRTRRHAKQQSALQQQQRSSHTSTKQSKLQTRTNLNSDSTVTNSNSIHGDFGGTRGDKIDSQNCVFPCFDSTSLIFNTNITEFTPPVGNDQQRFRKPMNDYDGFESLMQSSSDDDDTMPSTAHESSEKHQHQRCGGSSTAESSINSDTSVRQTCISSCTIPGSDSLEPSTSCEYNNPSQPMYLSLEELPLSHPLHPQHVIPIASPKLLKLLPRSTVTRRSRQLIDCITGMIDIDERRRLNIVHNAVIVV